MDMVDGGVDRQVDGQTSVRQAGLGVHAQADQCRVAPCDRQTAWVQKPWDKLMDGWSWVDGQWHQGQQVGWVANQL